MLVALAYAAGLQGGFVYDDHGSIEENAFLADSASLARTLSLRTIIDPNVPDGRRPLVILSYFLDRAVWGLRPFGYHLTNLVLHLLAVALVLVLMNRLLPGRPAAGYAAALLFGLHPALTEAVQVPAFREDLLVTVFLLLHLTAACRPGLAIRHAWLSTAALALALVSKESAVVGPVLMALVWGCFPHTRPPRREGIQVLAAHAGLVAVCVFFWLMGGLAGPRPGPPVALPFPYNLFTAPWLWLKALRTFAWPFPLLADYVIAPVSGILDARFLVGLAATILWAAAAVVLVRPRPLLAFGMGWMLIAFLPVANLVPLFNAFAERYLYLLGVGFAALLAGALSFLPGRQRALVLAAAAVLYGGLTVRRLGDWADDYTLWSRTLAREPASARAHTWVGLELKARGAPEEALWHWREADRLNPRDVNALINIGILHGQQGDLRQAEQVLREAVRRRFDKADAHWNLAFALLMQGKEAEGIEEARQTLVLDPFHPAARAFMKETQEP